MSLLAGIKALSLRLWDESAKKLIGFRHLRKIKKASQREDGSVARDPGRRDP